MERRCAVAGLLVSGHLRSHHLQPNAAIIPLSVGARDRRVNGGHDAVVLGVAGAVPIAADARVAGDGQQTGTRRRRRCTRDVDVTELDWQRCWSWHCHLAHLGAARWGACKQHVAAGWWWRWRWLGYRVSSRGARGLGELCDAVDNHVEHLRCAIA